MAAQPAPARLTSSGIDPTVAELAVYAAGILSAAAGAVHLWAAPHHLAEWWGYGAFFVAVAAAQGLYALALLRWPTRRLSLLGIYANLALVSLYAVTRTTGVPFFGPHAGHAEEVGAVDLVAVSAELGLVLALIPLSGSARTLRSYLAPAAFQALGAGLVLHLLRAGAHGAHDGLAQGWLQGAIPVLPLSLLALLVSTPLVRRASAYLFGDETGTSPRLFWATASALVYASAHTVASAPDSLPEAARELGVVLGVALLALGVVAALRGAPWEERRPFGLWHPRVFAGAAGLAVGFAVLAGPSPFGQYLSAEAEAQASGQCSAASYDRSYDVAAINVDIPYNRWGKTDPHGQLFVLQGDKEAVKNWYKPLEPNAADDPAGNRRLRPRPLVIRANAGECVKVNFTNELNDVGGDSLPNNPRASMKVFGPSYDAQASDGSAVGFNDDTTVANKDDAATPQKENNISYYWRAPGEEGLYLFRDQGAATGSEADGGSLGHGLYGGFAVEPAGSTWTDPTTGEALYAGDKNHDRITKGSGDPYIDADINPAGGKSFRETIQMSQDELPAGNGFGFNYGAEPGSNRVAKNPAGDGEFAGELAPDAIGEETSLSSWTYGDPALVKLASGKGPWLPAGDRSNDENCGLPGSCYVSNVVHSYPGDPTKIRFAHAGVKETHVFHMHAHQWLAEPGDVGTSGAPSGEISDSNRPHSTTIDSQTYGPGETFTADLLFGAGSRPGTFGDSIFHCHLYPHFADGFWALFRVHDVYEDGSGKTPDGVKVRELKKLQNRAAPPPPTADNPGYPRFMPGKFGWRAPQAPGSVSEASGTPDDPNTTEREDLEPADRVVAGRPLNDTLDPGNAVEKELSEKLAVEKKVQDLNYGGAAAKPGAPFRNPCPAGSREVTYNVSVVQTDVEYNEAGWHDKQGRILVLDSNLNPDGTLKKDAEPLFIRVNAGDCVNFNLTNRLPNWFGGDEFVQLAQTNMVGGHIHLVKFDVLGSDGSSNGWNYQGAAFSKEQADFDKNLDADGNVQNCGWTGCRVPKPASFDPSAAGAPSGQTIHERWYADYELRTVFTHDHHFPALDQNRGLFGALIVEPKGMDFRNPKTGEFYQPGNGSSPGAPNCGDDCEGRAAGTAMDVIGPGARDDFREFGLAIQDFVSLHKSDADGGAPIAAPNAAEEFPDADPGTMGINYRNAPFVLRREKNGQKVDPAHVFSSSVHGDPATPVLEAYSEDPVRVRMIQGSQEEQHVVTMNGVRWREEPDDPESPLINSKAIGISEAFNFEVPKLVCGPDDATCAGDYLYSGTATDDLYTGAWGIMRARGKPVASLKPLPDNAPQSPTSTEAPTTTVPQNEGAPLSTSGSLAPPAANSPGTPCPTGAPTRTYNVVAMQKEIKYNKQGDKDPYGLMYVLAEDEAAVRSGAKKPEPLTIRANEGDCISVRLTNKLTSGFLQHGGISDGDPNLPTEPDAGTPAGIRVSLHPQLVRYDVRGSDGTAVGYNRDSTVAPGETKLYRWYADDAGEGEVGATNLTDFGDVRGHRHHGLFAGLNIEPKGSTWHDPRTGAEIKSGASADIRVPGAGNDFREFTTFFQDGLNLRDASGAIIEDPLDHPPTPEEPQGEPMDAEDQGEKGFNYSNAPFEHRIGGVPEAGMEGRKMANVFSSKAHGDPDTPIFRAFAGDPVRMRVLQGSDKPRQHTFQLSGASWKAQHGDPGSTTVGSQGGISVGRAVNAHLGTNGPGDYRYGCTVGFHHLSGGLWGIMRVYPKPGAGALDPNPLRNVDDPRANGNHPILPLELSSSATSLGLAAPATVDYGKAVTLFGKLLRGPDPLVGRQVILEHKPAGAASFSEVKRADTTAGGAYSFAGIVPQKSTDYRVRFAGDPRVLFAASESPVKRVGVKALVSNTTATTSLKLGGSRAITGSVSPSITGSVKVTIKRGTTVVVKDKLVPLNSSRFNFSYKPPSVGSYSVSVAFPGNASYLANTSPAKGFTVTR